MKRFIPVIAFGLVATGALAQELAQEPVMQESGDARWVCGGVGAEERHALATLKPQANLEVEFVTVKRGGFIADVDVSLYRGKSAEPLLSVKADGPQCLFQLPPGRYRVEATYRDTTRRLNTTVARRAGRPARVVLPFADEPWDGISASLEEKQQTKEQ